MTLLLLASFACNKNNPDSGLTDADADGFASDVDCNDDDETINPEATEVCDEVDNDCDDLVDEDTTIDLFPDADEDGFGDADNPTEGCSPGSGYVVNGDDCDDGNAEVNPDANEVCNDIDDDCDDDIDDADASLDPTSELEFYRDEDSDGYGWEANVTTACEAPSGYVDNADDCNDALDTISPDADEICNGIDDDCDGLVDGDDPSIDPGSVSEFFADDDGDGYGDDIVLACELAYGLSETGGDCDDSNMDVNPGEEESCSETDSNCDEDAWAGATDAWFHADSDGSWTEADLNGWVGTDAGTLYVCEGTFDSDITLEADIDIVGLGEKVTVLDGGSARGILTIETDSITVDISGVSFENGLAVDTETTMSYYGIGGGLVCNSDAAVNISDSAFKSNVAATPGIGGAIFVDGCTLSLDSVELSKNSADFGGAVFAFSGLIELQDSEVFLNDASSSGGVFYGYTTGSSNVISFDETAVYGNSAVYYGGALMLDIDSEAYCYGSTTSIAGFWNNTAGTGFGGGAIRVFASGALFEADTCDFGTNSGGDNNSPDDIYTDTGTYDTADTGAWGYDFEDDYSVTCTVGGGCE